MLLNGHLKNGGFLYMLKQIGRQNKGQGFGPALKEIPKMSSQSGGQWYKKETDLSLCTSLDFKIFCIAYISSYKKDKNSIPFTLN